MENKVIALLAIAACVAAIWLIYDIAMTKRKTRQIDDEIREIDEWLLNESIMEIANLTKRVAELEQISRSNDEDQEIERGYVECCSCGKEIPLDESNMFMFDEGGDLMVAKYFCDDCFGKIAVRFPDNAIAE